ncbi:hypothetical protein N8J89_01650 [Crossiella sp. CA-258035]|uniref:hypothetical protein n=1 Tax=Crossiella sp. CA-258035 TaxID=2981138 RepID=UPI0024BC2D9A|nr:hypothetical protein [Crossiella sp. CA-258035]WHT19811.1 hypothetical protein N8J89_01650 [Crossiella sp. CA-258035]
MTTAAVTEPTGRRLTVAGVAGVLPGLVMWLVNALITGQVLCTNQGFNCLGVALLAFPLGVVAGAGLAWLALHLAGVERAWRIALLGPVGIWAAGRVLTELSVPLPQPVLLLLYGVLGYLVAAFATASRVAWPWRLGVALLVLVPALLLSVG